MLEFGTLGGHASCMHMYTMPASGGGAVVVCPAAGGGHHQV